MKKLVLFVVLILFLSIARTETVEENIFPPKAMPTEIDWERGKQTEELNPPTNFAATVNGRNVHLSWDLPEGAAAEGNEWITWCNVDYNGDSIGTGAAAEFGVYHTFDASDLAAYQGNVLSQIKFAPNWADCIYTVKIWTGGTATTPADLVYSAEHNSPIIGAWNLHILPVPIAIPADRIWIGYEVDTQGGCPAGCDNGPMVNGKGNIMYFGGWTTLVAIEPSLTVNWSIQGFVAEADGREITILQPLEDNVKPRPVGELKLANFEPSRENRALLGYKVYRNNQLLTTLNNAGNTQYADLNLALGTYSYTVTAFYDSGESEPAGPVNVTIINLNPPTALVAEVDGDTVNLQWHSPLPSRASDPLGRRDVNSSPLGVFEPQRDSRVLTGYKVYRDGRMLAQINDTATTTYQDAGVPNGNYTYFVTAVYHDGESIPAIASVTMDYSWPDTLFEDDFEAYPDFALQFAPWTLIDQDASDTYGVPDADFPNSGLPMAYTIFNPSATIPPLNGADAHSGNKMAASFAAIHGPNRDWLITPRISLGYGRQFRFYAKSFNPQSGLERFRVGVSTAPVIISQSFQDISGPNDIEAPPNWTEYSYDLSAYNAQDVYIAIRCVSNDASVFMVDDVSIYIEPYAGEAPLNLCAGIADSVAEISWAAPMANYVFSYRIWRLKEGDETNEANWTLLSPDFISETAFEDAAWENLPPGAYRWAVKAYMDDIVSEAAFSNPIDVIVPPTNLQASVDGNKVKLNWTAPATVLSRSILSTVSSTRSQNNRALLGYNIYRNGEILAQFNNPAMTTYQNLRVPQGEYIYGVSAVYHSGESSPATVAVTVNIELPDSSLEEDFEAYPDFALQFAPWTLLDQDGSNTFGFSGTNFPSSGSPMAYIIFNSSATTPPIEGLTAYSGDKMAASFAAVNAANDDWLISPRIYLGRNGILKFYARSYTAQYGLERFRIGLSNLPTINPQAFQYISGESFIEAPANWTEYSYDLSDYDTQDVYIAIRCVSDNAFVFFVDDISIQSEDPASVPDNVTPVLSTRLMGNYPNPFNPETTIRYSLKENTPVTIGIYNVKGQLVKSLVNEQKTAGEHSIVWNGWDNNNRPVPSGIYFFKMNAGKYSATKKMIMMK